MNEKIKQLAEQAGYSKDFLAIGLPNNMEKFAELIVQECADVAKHHVMNISTYADADFVDKQIREHFGVK